MLLEDLSIEVKKIWSQSKKWRNNNGNIEFSIETTYGDEWFPVYNSPKSVEKFVLAYLKLNK